MAIIFIFLNGFQCLEIPFLWMFIPPNSYGIYTYWKYWSMADAKKKAKNVAHGFVCWFCDLSHSDMWTLAWFVRLFMWKSDHITLW